MSHVLDMHRARVAGSHLFAANDSPDDDDREELRRMDRAQRSGGSCQCFGPGEAGGSCPGPANCPMADDRGEAA